MYRELKIIFKTSSPPLRVPSYPFARKCVLKFYIIYQGSKIALVRSFLRVPQAAGQVKILIFQVKIKFFPIYANSFCDAGQVLIFRYFEPCICNKLVGTRGGLICHSPKCDVWASPNINIWIFGVLS